MDEDALLRSVTQWRGKKRKAAEGIGAVLKRYTKYNLRRCAKQTPVIDAWAQLLPAGLRGHCELVSLRAGALIIKAVPGAYMFELQACKAEILSSLRQQCPAARIERIVLKVKKEKAKTSGG